MTCELILLANAPSARYFRLGRSRQSRLVARFFPVELEGFHHRPVVDGE
jgi:hypothetical protein